MTAPGSQAPAGRPAAPAPPPNPKIQAVTFALQLAEIRANTGVAGDRVTTVQQLISDAGEIAAFIGTGRVRNDGV
jgi:hypothetical protein